MIRPLATHGVIASSYRRATGPVDTSTKMFRLGGYTYAPDGTTIINEGAADGSYSEFEPVAGMVIDSSGHIIMAGIHSVQSFSSLGAIPFVSKYDSTGNTIFQVDLTDFTQANGVACDTTGNVYVVGTNGSLGMVTKLSHTGTLVWQKTFTDASSNACTFAACKWSGGNLFVTGAMTLPDTTAYIVTAKIGPSGNVVWEKYFGNGTTANPSASGTSIEIASNGDIIVGYQPSVTTCFGVVRYDSTGTQIWNVLPEQTSGTSTFIPRIALDTSDNVYAAMDDGNTSAVRVVKLAGADGSFVWSKRYMWGDYNGLWYFQFYHSFITASGDDLYVTGWMDAYNSSDFWIMKLDSNGAKLWERALHDGGTTREVFNSACSVIDNGLLYLGASKFYNTVDRFYYGGIVRMPLEPTADIQFVSDRAAVSSLVETIFEINVTDYVGDNNLDPTSQGFAPVADAFVITDTTATASLTTYDNTGWTVPDAISGVYQGTSGNGYLLVHGTDMPQYGDVEFYATAADSSGIVCVGFDASSDGAAYSANDTIVVKFSSAGAVLWSQSIKAKTFNEYNVVLDTNSDIYISGASNSNVGLYKFNSSGVAQWQQTFSNNSIGDTGLADIGGITIDSTYLYVGAIAFGKSGNTTPQHPQLFKLAKSNGSLVAQKQIMPSTDNLNISSLNMAPDGNLLATVFVGGGTGNGDVVLLKLDTNFTSIAWQRQYGTTNIEHSAGVVTDGATGDIYIIGDNNLVGDYNRCYLNITKYNNSGVHQFTRFWIGSSYDDTTIETAGFYWSAHAAVMLNGYIYAKATRYDLNSNGSDEQRSDDAVLIKFALDGSVVWSKTMYSGGTSGDSARAISTDGTYIYVTGSLSYNQYAAFVWKVDQSGAANGIYGGHYTIYDFPLTEATSFTLTEQAASLAAPTSSSFPITAGSATISATNTPTLAPKIIPFPTS